MINDCRRGFVFLRNVFFILMMFSQPLIPENLLTNRINSKIDEGLVFSPAYLKKRYLKKIPKENVKSLMEWNKTS